MLTIEQPRWGHDKRTSSFRIPQTAAVFAEMPVNEAGDGWAERLLLVGANPNEVPEHAK